MSSRFCPTCRAECEVEQPPCADGHVDCPEWICVDCGTVIVVGWLAADAPALVAASLSDAA